MKCKTCGDNKTVPIGRYQPFTGPEEDCKTCGGTGVMPEQGSDEVTTEDIARTLSEYPGCVADVLEVTEAIHQRVLGLFFHGPSYRIEQGVAMWKVADVVEFRWPDGSWDTVYDCLYLAGTAFGAPGSMYLQKKLKTAKGVTVTDCMFVITPEFIEWLERDHA